MGAAEPVHAVVGHARHFRVGAAHGLDVIGAEQGFEQLGADEGRVADDDVDFRPAWTRAVSLNQRIADAEVGVEIVERQGVLGDVEFVDGELVGEHHRHLGEFDGKGLNVHAVEVLAGNETERALGGVAAGEFAHALVDARFEPLEFAVGDVEEVAGAAGGVENAEVFQAREEFFEALERFGAVDLFAPGCDDGRADDFHDVDRAGEVGAEGVALGAAERVFEDGAEDFRAHETPVEGGGIFEQVEFVGGEFDARRFAEEAAVEVVDALEAAAGGLARRVHFDEEGADEVEALFGRGAVVEQAGEEVFVEQADVFGEQAHQALQHETLGEGRFDAAPDEVVVERGEQVGGGARDLFVVELEDWRFRLGEEEGERPPALRQFGQFELVDRGIHLGFEIEDPEFVEIAQHDVARPVGNEARPVFEGLAVVLAEVGAALLHFDEDDRLPDQIGEGGAAAVLLDAVLAGGAGFLEAAMAEGAEQVVEE